MAFAVVEYVPAWQNIHRVDPTFKVYEPMAHAKQDANELEPTVVE
jgi:hypothetical protein